MEIGSFRLSEIKEMLNAVSRYETDDDVYTLYAHCKNSYVKLLVNKKWMVCLYRRSYSIICVGTY